MFLVVILRKRSVVNTNWRDLNSTTWNTSVNKYPKKAFSPSSLHQSVCTWWILVKWFLDHYIIPVKSLHLLAGCFPSLCHVSPSVLKSHILVVPVRLRPRQGISFLRRRAGACGCLLSFFSPRGVLHLRRDTTIHDSMFPVWCRVPASITTLSLCCCSRLDDIDLLCLLKAHNIFLMS